MGMGIEMPSPRQPWVAPSSGCFQVEPRGGEICMFQGGRNGMVAQYLLHVLYNKTATSRSGGWSWGVTAYDSHHHRRVTIDFCTDSNRSVVHSNWWRHQQRCLRHRSLRQRENRCDAYGKQQALSLVQPQILFLFFLSVCCQNGRFVSLQLLSCSRSLRESLVYCKMAAEPEKTKKCRKWR